MLIKHGIGPGTWLSIQLLLVVAAAVVFIVMGILRQVTFRKGHGILIFPYGNIGDPIAPILVIIEYCHFCKAFLILHMNNGLLLCQPGRGGALSSVYPLEPQH